MATTIPNFSFESDFTGWTTSAGSGAWAIRSDKAHNGTKAAWFTGAVGTTVGVVANDLQGAVYEGQFIEAQCWISLDTPDDSNSAGWVTIQWLDAADAVVSEVDGRLVSGDTRGAWHSSYASGNAPAGATQVKIIATASANENGGVLIDEFTWNHLFDRTITLTSPVNGATYGDNDTIPLSISTTGTEPEIVSVAYIFDDGINPPVTLATTDVSPYSYNVNAPAAGTYDVIARATVSGGSTIDSASVSITVSATPPPPTTREYKASNAYTYLVGSNFFGLGSAIPSTAQVTAVEVELSYKLHILSRTKDIDIEDPEGSNTNTVFDLAPTASFEAVLLDEEDGSYTLLGNSAKASVDINNDDFTLTEEGTSEDMKWTVFEQATVDQVTIGSDTNMFGVQSIQAVDFLNKYIGIKFYPDISTIPSYSERGDACFRVFIDKFRIRVYFDAGSVFYYFASPDKTQVIKGELAAAYVGDGDFETGDASGTLQLTPTLEVMDGTQTWIDADWTIHAAYPPTDDNQIGLVDEREAIDGIGMSYNGLPSQGSIIENRSRYEFITANFYGDDALDSIYGANGIGRGFSYNGQFFYTIQTTPEDEKDKPRHVAYHHGHLAFGFNEGRVDISVAGQPYNYDGALGASSWSMGDKVHGLLPLSGTILGVFCSNMIWGLSGTTVDNFATQIISPKMGAIEYTVTDMGFPVYANAYGIYTLAQTQQYGDYLGTPMSQDISPWLRPRLIRKSTSNKEVVVAWPVRSKNQYRLAFADGYIASMTINAGMQQAPTFSFQQYTLFTEDDE